MVLDIIAIIVFIICDKFLRIYFLSAKFTIHSLLLAFGDPSRGFGTVPPLSLQTDYSSANIFNISCADTLSISVSFNIVSAFGSPFP